MSTPFSFRHVADGHGDHLLVVAAGDFQAHFYLAESMEPEDIELLLQAPRLSKILARWADSPRSAVISLVTYLSETAGRIAELCIEVERRRQGRPACAEDVRRAMRAAGKAGVSSIERRSIGSDIKTPRLLKNSESSGTELPRRTRCARQQ